MSSTDPKRLRILWPPGRSDPVVVGFALLTLVAIALALLSVMMFVTRGSSEATLARISRDEQVLKADHAAICEVIHDLHPTIKVYGCPPQGAQRTS